MFKHHVPLFILLVTAFYLLLMSDVPQTVVAQTHHAFPANSTSLIPRTNVLKSRTFIQNSNTNDQLVVYNDRTAQIINEGEIRTGASGTGNVLGHVCIGDQIEYIGWTECDISIWYNIRVSTSTCVANGTTGWIHSSQSSLPVNQSGYVACSVVAIAPVPQQPAPVEPTPIPVPQQPAPVEPTPIPISNPYYTGGRDDYNCADFSTWDDANRVYQANLPDDPNHLDGNGDGIPCNDLWKKSPHSTP